MAFIDKTKIFTPAELVEKFIELYGGTKDGLRVFAAPARINIIGEHIDYNGGHVFPTAIDRYIYCAIRKREDKKITYQDMKFPGVYSFSIDDDFSYAKENDYANYLNGMISILKKRGFKFPCGFDLLMVSNIPPAGGISSSSALECGFGYAVSESFGFNVSRKDIALIGQQSEHEFMNVNCGIMDQYIIATSKKDTVELLDCAKIEHEYVPLELGEYCFVVMNTNKKRQLADSKYNERRSQCEHGLALLQKAAIPLKASGKYSNTKDLPDLCSLTPEQFEECKCAIVDESGKADEIILKRVRHCVTEEARVKEAVVALQAGKLERLGELLRIAHASMRDDYEATGIELDTLAETANAFPDCIGARMTGAGFGGCAIALVKKSATEKFIDTVQKAYTEKIGYEAGFFECGTSDGVFEVQL